MLYAKLNTNLLTTVTENTPTLVYNMCNVTAGQTLRLLKCEQAVGGRRPQYAPDP